MNTHPTSTKETPETIAELLALAHEGGRRPFTPEERERITELIALSPPVDPEWNGLLPTPEPNGAVEFWCALSAVENTRIRDENIRFVGAPVALHIVRVAKGVPPGHVETRTL